MKKFFTLVLMALMVTAIATSVANAENKWNFTLSAVHDSRYIFYGIDFGAKNDAAVDTFGITASKGSFNAYAYATTSQNYFEWGGSMDYALSVGPISLKTVVFPFGWATHRTFWGVVFIEELNVNNPIAPITALWSYDYVPDEEFKDLNGHYFYVGVSRELFGFKLQAGVNHNRNFFSTGKGSGGLIGITRSVELTEKVALDIYFKYYINAAEVNEDEKVVGATLLVKL
jgi:hypothetical protein